MTTRKVQVSFYVISRRFIEVDVPDVLEDNSVYINGINRDAIVEDHITGRVPNTLPYIFDIRRSMIDEARSIDGWVDWDDRNGITVTATTKED